VCDIILHFKEVIRLMNISW